MRIGRYLAGAGALTAIGMLVAPGLAKAHTAEVNPSCDGLSVTVALYDPQVVTTITIDGQSTQKDGNGTWNTPWDPTKSHTWAVKVIDPVDHQDRTFGPETQGACVTPTTAAPTTTEPATTAPTTTVPTTTDQTTTTVASSTTQPGSTTTTTTARATSTTSVGGSTSSGSSSSGSGSLPATGYASGVIASLAGACVIAGASLWMIARRRSVS
jgi:LPXTG-motif cell wall-anchored protein